MTRPGLGYLLPRPTPFPITHGPSPPSECEQAPQAGPGSYDRDHREFSGYHRSKEDTCGSCSHQGLCIRHSLGHRYLGILWLVSKKIHTHIWIQAKLSSDPGFCAVNFDEAVAHRISKTKEPAIKYVLCSASLRGNSFDHFQSSVRPICSAIFSPDRQEVISFVLGIFK